MKFNNKTLGLFCAVLLCFTTNAAAEHFSGSKINAPYLADVLSTEMPDLVFIPSVDNSRVVCSLFNENGDQLIFAIEPYAGNNTLDMYADVNALSSKDSINKDVADRINEQESDFLNGYHFFYDSDNKKFWLEITYDISGGFETEDLTACVEDFAYTFATVWMGVIEVSDIFTL